jgi:tetratricopeptide (TPR) repeat protein
MEVKRIQQLIESPEGFMPSDIDSLAELCEKYPFVGTFKQLYLIALKETESIKFSESLNKTAAWIPSRRILKDIIDEKLRLAKQKPRFEEPINLKVEGIEKPSSVQLNALENIAGEEEEISDSVELTNAAVAPLGSPEKIKNTETEIQEPEPPVFDYEKSPEPSAYFDAENSVEDKKSVKKSFSDWLKASKSTENVPQNAPENKKSLQQKIIDDFIVKQPKIGAVNISNVSVNQGVSDKISMVEPEDYITETLAQVYEKQGNFSKAIASYGKLKLKYPEKSDYFATQIERLNQLKKNKE